MLYRSVNEQMTLLTTVGGVHLVSVVYDGPVRSWARVYWRARCVSLGVLTSVSVRFGVRVLSQDESVALINTDAQVAVAGARLQVCGVAVYDLVPGDVIMLHGRGLVSNVWALVANGFEVVVL